MPKTIRRKSTSDAVEILRRDLIGNDPRAAAEYEQLKADLTVAREIHGLRQAAGLTQAQLARRIGASQTVIRQLEAADYAGDSLVMLNRAAVALGFKEVRVRLVDMEAHHLGRGRASEV